jgi:hypothetical protein
MTKSRFRSLAFPLIVIPLGGLLMMALTFLFFAVLYNLLEALFFANDPSSFPAGFLRMAYALVLVMLYLLLLRTKLSDLLKAILLTGPLAAVIIAMGHALYELPAVSIPAMFAVTAICGILLYRSRKPWVYYYAGAIGALVAIVYAWPRP